MHVACTCNVHVHIQHVRVHIVIVMATNIKGSKGQHIVSTIDTVDSLNLCTNSFVYEESTYIERQQTPFNVWFGVEQTRDSWGCSE